MSDKHLLLKGWYKIIQLCLNTIFVIISFVKCKVSGIRESFLEGTENKI